MALPPLEPAQRKNLLYVGVFLALAAFGFYDRVYTPRKAAMAELETRLEQLKTVNARSRAITQGAEGAVNEQMALYRQQLEMAEGLIPSSEELPNLLDAISAEATRTGVELTLIQPVGATEEAYYTRRVYDMAVVGEYHQIGEFLTRVASLPRIVTATNLSVAPFNRSGQDASTAGTSAAQVPLEARFSIETYVIPS
ncbi:MAG TPA: type 4a pilus biogenesis protein PilO, partial [Longimicrobium sp.]|nr:type 4a pilus biogenesis protein PilO [Longimicrobium sp.]